jgi:pimeloyl-ACP methyl ester carboxylesterase
MQAVEASTYTAAGKLYAVPTALGDFNDVTTASPATPGSFLMHMYCQGPDLRTYNRPTIVLEADSGTSGYALIGLQSILTGSTRAWRVCWYDRAGYGWSHQPPLGASTPAITVARLNSLLVQSSEVSNKRGIILVGHGAGAELAQIYAAVYPAQVSGLALLDGYSNIDRLLGTASDDVFKATTAVCGTLEIGRALETVAIMRAVTDEYTRRLQASNNIFTPSQLLPNYLSTQTNGKYWAAMYSDLCINKGAAVAATDYLTGLVLPGMKSGTLAGVRWPKLKAGVPLLVLSAGNTVTGTSDAARQSYRQAALYNATLSASNSSRWKVCPGCDHSFAFDAKTAWVAGEIHNYFYNLL